MTKAATVLRLGLTALLGSGSALAADQQASVQPPVERASLSAVKQMPIYAPPLRGAPATRVGGASRGDAYELILSALAPDHTGLTTRAQPVLYWYLSRAVTAPMEFTLSDEQAKRTLLEIRLKGPAQAGIHHLRLPLRELTPGVEYQWFISLVPDAEQRAHDIIAGGAIQRVQPAAALSGQLNRTSRPALPAIYAEQGLWYDAIAALSELIEASPENKDLRAQRAALLEQVGLTAAAAYERSASGK